DAGKLRPQLIRLFLFDDVDGRDEARGGATAHGKGAVEVIEKLVDPVVRAGRVSGSVSHGVFSLIVSKVGLPGNPALLLSECNPCANRPRRLLGAHRLQTSEKSRLPCVQGDSSFKFEPRGATPCFFLRRLMSPSCVALAFTDSTRFHIVDEWKT